MPIPLTTFFRNESLAKNNTCRTLLRGTLLYDYADSNITWSTTAGSFVSSLIPQNESWTYFIPRSMTMTTTTQLTRSSNFGSSKNFTIMFRFYAASLSPPGMTGTTVIGSGTPSMMPPVYFWAIFMSGSTATTQTFQLIWTSGGNFQPTFNIGPATYVQAGKWYHVALKIVDEGVSNSLYGYIDGIQVASSLFQSYIDPPVGSTRIGNLGLGQAQGFEVTEVIFLEKALSNDEILGYASSPYL